MMKAKLVAEALDEAERVRTDVFPSTLYPTATEIALVNLADRYYELQRRMTDAYFDMED